MTSSFVRAQIPVRGKGSNKCPRHSKKEVVFICLDCQEQLVCEECETTSHQGHTFAKLSDVVEEKRKAIQKFIDKTEIITLPSIKSEIIAIEDRLRDNSKSLQKAMSDITKRAEHLKSKIDEIMKSMIENCKTLEVENEETLEKYRAKLCTVNLDLQTTVKECNRTLSSSSVAKMFDTSRDLHSVAQQPNHPDLQLVDFNEGCWDLPSGFGLLSTRVVKYLTDNGTRKRNEAKLERFEYLSNTISDNIKRILTKKQEKEDCSEYDTAKLIGNPQQKMLMLLDSFTENLIEESRENINNLRDLIKHAPTPDAQEIWQVKTDCLEGLLEKTIEDFRGDTASSEKTARSQSVDDEWEMVPKRSSSPMDNTHEPKTLTVFTSSVATFRKSSLNINALFPATKDSVWVASDNGRQALLYSKNGDVKEMFKSEIEISDISISPVTGNLWLCSADKTIREQSTFLYLYSSMVVRFTTVFMPLRFAVTKDSTVVVAGDKTVRVFTTDGTQLHSAIRDSTGKFVVNHPQGLAVCPLTENIAICNKDENRHVVVLSKRLEIQFRYPGTSERNAKDTNTFYPIDATFDLKGRLLLAVNDSKSIVMLNHIGQLIGTVHSDLVRPVTVHLHHSGILWIGFENGMVKSLKVIEK